MKKFHFPDFLIVMLDKDREAIVCEVDHVVHAPAIGAAPFELQRQSVLLPQSWQVFQEGVLDDW